MGVFDDQKRFNSILDFFTYDLSTFFYDDYKEIDSEETPATFMIVYQKDLPWKELSIFDAVQFRIFFDKDTITGINPINVKFISSQKQGDTATLKEIIEKILHAYPVDNVGNKSWSDQDIELYKTGKYRRVWTIEKGESFVSVEYSVEDGITLNILFFNNLLKFSDKYHDLKH